MPPDADTLSRARGVLATTPCLEIGDHLHQLQPCELYKGVVHEEDVMTTWLPRDRVACALQALPDGHTVILLDDTVFYASPEASLVRGCPRNVVFYGHYTEDVDADGGRTARILVYDVWLTDEGRLHPRERYHELRGRLARYLPSPLCIVQWVGFRYAAQGIMQRRHEYPHEIEGLLCLTPDCRRAVQPLHVDVPVACVDESQT